MESSFSSKKYEVQRDPLCEGCDSDLPLLAMTNASI